MKVLASISVGELFDKLSILQIKREKILNPTKLNNVKNEIKELQKSIIDSSIREQTGSNTLTKLRTSLYEINLALWNIEDELRGLESQKKFDKKFISLARRVYITNDRRAEIKREINKLTGSDIIEEKHYSDY